MKTLTCVVIISAVIAFATPIFSADTEKVAAPVAAGEAAQPKEVSVYGEVQSVNEQALSFVLQYYDYDTDEEKTAEIVMTEDTKLENAASLKDVKKGDWADATYTMDAGRCLAASVIIEKEESEEAEPAEKTAVVAPAEE